MVRTVWLALIFLISICALAALIGARPDQGENGGLVFVIGNEKVA
jgi:hypothetical protein